MEYLFKAWDKLRKDLAGRSLFLLLDYDGTLTPIVKHPDEAVLSMAVKSLLRDLSKAPQCRLGIISGRALKDIRQKVGIKNIIYAGNHGLEVTGPEISMASHVSKRLVVILKKIGAELSRKLTGIQGVFLEDKGATLSIHYRLASPEAFVTARKILREVGQTYLFRKQMILCRGKKVIEVRPNVSWDKGKMVEWLLKKYPFYVKRSKTIPVYLGDDRTDEDAFRILKNKGITILVGRKRRSYARYYLRNTSEVERFLNMIMELYGEKHARNN